MASSLALKRAVNSPVIFDLVRSISGCPAVAATRSFNTNAQMTSLDEDEGGVDVDRRAHRSVSRRSRDSSPTLFSDDVFDPFSAPRSVNQLLNLMEQMMQNPFMAASRGMGAGAGSRRAWDVREDENWLHLRMDMPGVDKDQVKISVENNTLIIKGESEKESEEEEHGRRYSSRIDLPQKLYKLDGIKAEMKNGVLKVVVPKVKEDERKDVFQVKIQ